MRQAQRLNDQWSKIDQIRKKSDGSTWYEQHQCVYSPLSSSRTPHQHANTRHSEQQTRLGDAPDLRTVAPRDYLDHRASVAPKRVSRPRHLRSEHIHSRSAMHFPRYTLVGPCLARGYDWPTIRERLVVSSGKLVPIIHEERQADVHEWSWFWFSNRECARAFESSLQTPEAQLAA